MGLKELKPHLFKHQCKASYGSGLMKCPKCDGWGTMERASKSVMGEMTIERRRRTYDPNDQGGMYECNYCQVKGVKECTTCQGQGWQFLPYINYRKFQPHPKFEEFHMRRDRVMARDVHFEKKIQRQAFNEKIDESREQKEIEEKRKRKEEKARKKAEKEAKAKARDDKKKGKQKA